MVGRWHLAVLSSATITVALGQFPKYMLRSSYGLTFTAFLLAHFVGLAVWHIIVWPKVFSPLRHLPHPPVCTQVQLLLCSQSNLYTPQGESFFNGHFWYVLKEPTGNPMRRWINEVPNEGLIRYNMIFNRERIFITSARALGEVLVQKNYEFIKPRQLRAGLGRILGVGILLAEGDEHKVRKFTGFVSCYVITCS